MLASRLPVPFVRSFTWQSKTPRNELMPIAVDKPSIRAGSRILLLDGGSLDKVRTWDGQGEWENRVSSLTAENIAWLDSENFNCPSS